MSPTPKLHGIIPPMTTAFNADGAIDESCVRAQVRWLIEQGVHGVAAGGSTGEGHTLDVDEFRGLIAATCDEAAGRIPVIAGIIVDSTRDAIRRGLALRDLDVAALQVTPVHYLFRPSDDAMLTHGGDETVHITESLPFVVRVFTEAVKGHHETASFG